MVILERINVLKRRFTKEDTLAISDYLEEELIAFIDVDSQKKALMSLIELLDEQGKLQDKQAFYEAILKRENIVSTGIGIGVAIPHAKLPNYTDFFIAIAIQKGTGIEWKALDDLPVRLIFMIGGPEDAQTEYLNILSMITSAIKDEERRKELLKAKTPQDVIAVFDDL